LLVFKHEWVRRFALGLHVLLERRRPPARTDGADAGVGAACASFNGDRNVVPTSCHGRDPDRDTFVLDRRAGRYTERNKLVALKALAKWLAEKRLSYEQRGDQRLSILRDVKLPPVPAMGRRPFDDREVKEIIAAIPRAATYPMRERAILTLQFSAPMRPDEVRRILVVDFRERDRDKRGHIVIRGSKTEAGTDRLIPLVEQAQPDPP
jgi:integrase